MKRQDGCALCFTLKDNTVFHGVLQKEKKKSTATDKKKKKKKKGLRLH